MFDREGSGRTGRGATSVRSAARATLWLTLALAGCYSPEIQDGGFSCERNGRCPEGFDCVTHEGKEVCRSAGTPSADGGVPAACPVTDETAANSVAGSANSFGMALDGSGRVHLVFIAKTSGEVWHRWKEGTTWHQSQVNARATGLAVAIDGEDRLQLIYGNKDSANLVHHALFDISGGGTWTVPTRVVVKNADLGLPDCTTESLDITASKNFIFAAVTGQAAGGPLYKPFRIKPKGTGYEYIFNANYLNHIKSPTGAVRVAAGPSMVAATHTLDGRDRRVKHYPHHQMSGVVFRVIDKALGPGPMAAAMDDREFVHLAYVQQQGGSGGPVYSVLWELGYGARYVYTPAEVFAKEPVLPESVDVTVDKFGIAHISFIGADSKTFYWASKARTHEWPINTLAVQGGRQTRVRARNNTLHLAQLDSVGKIRYNCRLISK